MKRIAVFLLAACLVAMMPLTVRANDYGTVDIVVSSVVVADGEGYASFTWTLDGPVASELRTAMYQHTHPGETGTLSSTEIDAYGEWLETQILGDFSLGLIAPTELVNNLTADLVDGTTCDDESELTMTVSVKCEDAGRDAKPLNAALYSIIWPSYMGVDAIGTEITVHIFIGYVDTSGIAVTDGQEEGTNLGFIVFQAMYYETTYDDYADMQADAEAAVYTDQACCLCCTIFLVGTGAAGTLAIVALRRRK